MPLFEWYKKYSVNNEELDNHHKALFGILNRLYDNCLGKDIPNCLDPIVEELVSYSEYHFSAEEQYMKRIEYKEIDRHVLEHRAFTQRTVHLQQVVNKNDFELMKELIVFLGNWLLHHVMEEDKKYSL
jgi:hemerythrin-like metal-binding protein